MTIDKLSVFCTVYETQSIKATADKLLMDSAMISRIIKQLETEYQITLFTRTHHGLLNTTQADLFYKYALEILELDQLSRTICSNRESIRIGCTSTIGTHLIPPVISMLSQENISLDCQLQVNTQERILYLLEFGYLDIALIEDELIYKENMIYERFGGDRLIPILPPLSSLSGKDIVFKDFCTPSFITREEGSSGKKHIERLFHAHQVPFNPTIECSSTLTIMELVHNGIGVSLIPEPYILRYFNGHFLSTCQIIDDKLERDYYIVTRKSPSFTPSLQKIIADLKCKLKSHAT